MGKYKEMLREMFNTIKNANICIMAEPINILITDERRFVGLSRKMLSRNSWKEKAEVTAAPYIPNNLSEMCWSARHWKMSEYILGVPVVAQRKQIWLAFMRTQIWSLASFSGLKIQHCCELWRRLQARLGSCVSVAVVWVGGYSSDWTPSLGTSTCHGCGPKKDKKEYILNCLIHTTTLLADAIMFHLKCIILTVLLSLQGGPQWFPPLGTELFCIVPLHLNDLNSRLLWECMWLLGLDLNDTVASVLSLYHSLWGKPDVML